VTLSKELDSIRKGNESLVSLNLETSPAKLNKSRKGLEKKPRSLDGLKKSIKTLDGPMMKTVANFSSLRLNKSSHQAIRSLKMADLDESQKLKIKKRLKMKKKSKASFLASFKGKSLESDFKILNFFKQKLKCVSNSQLMVKFKEICKKKSELEKFYSAVSGMHSSLHLEPEPEDSKNLKDSIFVDDPRTSTNSTSPKSNLARSQ
jgi:hypothetical protein